MSLRSIPSFPQTHCEASFADRTKSLSEQGSGPLGASRFGWFSCLARESQTPFQIDSNTADRSGTPDTSYRRGQTPFPKTIVLIPGILVVLLMSLVASTAVVVAQPTTTERPQLKDLNGHFPFQVPESAEQWKIRAEALRLQTRVALAVHPLPPLAPPRATIHGRRAMDGYSIEKVILESLAGHFVTGSLYRPLGSNGESDSTVKRPAVMYAHGHWDNGRFYEASPAAVKILLATGAERFENAATNHMQAACVQLARMGCVVFQYDMIGYADSQQISFDRGHRWGIGIENPPTAKDRWALFSTTAEGYGQSIMGLQTINTIAALEMLRGLDDVDPDRIAITGASGGGTQSFIATAVETRLAGSLPAVMVSTAMQGGCVCENACGLRVATGNIELAGLTGPRPLAMTTANDWTIKMPEDGFPELLKLYQLIGNPKSVELFTGAHFPHNYNHVTRVSMYGWMNRLFKLGHSEPILERDFDLIHANELTVWDSEHPRPPSGIEHEERFCRQWANEIDKALKISPNDSTSDRENKLTLLREGWKSITGWSSAYRGYLASSGKLQRIGDADVNNKNLNVADLYLTHADAAEHENGKAWEDRIKAAAASDPSGAVWTVSTVDPVTGKAGGESPLVANPRPAAAYTYGYNAPPLVRRLAVLIDAIEEVHTSGHDQVRLIVNDDQILLAAMAAVQHPERVQSISWVTSSPTDYDPLHQVSSIRDPHFLPNGLRYQSLTGLISILGDRIERVVP